MDLSTHLQQVNIGEPASAAGLKVFPLYPRAPRTLELSLLSDAVARREAVILEDETLGGGAWFRRVAIENRGGKTILVRDGDMLLGGKQDRTAERSCLVAAKSRVVIPAVYLATGLVMAWRTPKKTLALHLELFGDPSLCEQAWPGLVRGAAQCARGRPPRVSRTEIRGLIDELASATVAREADQSLGELVRLRFPQGTASVLFAGAELAHASVFAA